MLINYYEDGQKVASTRTSRKLLLLMTMNGLVAALVLFAWTLISVIASRPLAWATWMPVSRGYGIFSIFEYPFVMLWTLPLAGVCGAWVAAKARRWAVAYSAAGLPIALIAMIFGWYYLVPPEWH